MSPSAIWWRVQNLRSIVLEREIDQMALDLLAMEQPMAIDLRFILSVIKINADLERVGDQAVNIAEASP